MSNINYKFRVDFSGGTSNVYPIHEDMVLSSTRAENNKFLTSSLGVKFSFVGDDFEAIMGESIEWEFTMRIDKIGEDGVVVEDWRIGTFTRVDGEVFNEKMEERFEVSIELFDLYKKIQDKESIELEFFDLNVPAKPVRYDINPVFQIYNLFNGKISNHSRGSYWEEVAENPTRDVTILANNGFLPIGNILTFGMGFGEPNINGKYPNVSGTLFRNENNLYEIEFTFSNGDYNGELIRVSDGVVLYEYDGTGLGSLVDTAKFIHVDGEDVGVFIYQGINMYGRVLVGKDTVANQTVVELSNDDIGTKKESYTHYIAGSFLNVDVSTDVQLGVNNYPVSNIETGTNENRYIVELGSPPIWFPVLKSTWLGGAVFMNYSVTAFELFTSASKEVENKYCYELSDVMRALMNNLVDDVVVGNLLGEFFDHGANNPITGEGWKRIFITPLSNVKTPDFENPSTKQKIRYSEIKNFIEFAFNCYPYLDGNELKFEHNLFFENGKDYVTPIIGSDLTTALEAKNEKAWVYDTAKWKYAKNEIPSGIKSKWSNDGSNLFNGSQIKLLSKYADIGEPIDKSISRFMSDLEFIMNNPSLISSDGFCVLFVENDIRGNLKVDYEDLNTFGIQNGKGSFTYLHDKFWRHGLPCLKVEINGVEVDASSVKRTRIQEILFGDGVDIDNLNLIKTSLGDGEVERWDINLEDNSIRATLRHNLD